MSAYASLVAAYKNKKIKNYHKRTTWSLVTLIMIMLSERFLVFIADFFSICSLHNNNDICCSAVMSYEEEGGDAVVANITANGTRCSYTVREEWNCALFTFNFKWEICIRYGAK